MKSSGTTAIMGPGQAAPSLAEARDIAIDAYIYLYPLLSMDITRKQSTNLGPGKEFGKGPMNMFVSVAGYRSAEFDAAVDSNFDTPYSIAWLDLRQQPLVVSTPDTGGRCYLLWLLDLWTDVFASPGWRTAGTGAVDFLVTSPGWTVTVPEGMVHLKVPTPYIWIIGYAKTDDQRDYAAVHKIQEGFKVTPLSEWGRPPMPAAATIDSPVDMTPQPEARVNSMPAGDYFAYATELLKLHAPQITDWSFIARLKKIGIEPGKSFDISTLGPDVRRALEAAPGRAQELMKWKLPTLARVANEWPMNTDTLGVYGNYYLKRAIIARQGLGASLPRGRDLTAKSRR